VTAIGFSVMMALPAAAAAMACSIPFPLAGSRSKTIQSGDSRSSPREDHM